MPAAATRRAHPLPPSSSSSSGSSASSISKMHHSNAYSNHSALPPAADPLESDPEFDRLTVRFLKIKNQPFAVSGTVPMEGKSLSLFFRTKTGHSTAMDFPVDLDHTPCPEFNAFALECRLYSEATASHHHSRRGDAPPSPPSSIKGRKSTVSLHAPQEPVLIFPPSQTTNITFDISSHPILDLVRDVLFPSLPPGHFLVAQQAVAEIAFPGSRKRAPTREESPPNKVATLHLTLPVRFRGGALVVRHPEDVSGIEETFTGRGGKGGCLEWTAFLADCNTSLEPVEKGCRMTMVYNICLQSHQKGGMPDPVPPVLANHRFLDAMTPLFTRAKGRKLGFFLSGDYSVNPVDSPAGSTITQLKGSDSILYHAARLYHFKVELRYAGGGYIWPADRTIQLATTSDPISPASSASSVEQEFQGHSHRRRLSISSNRRDAAPQLSHPHSSSSQSSSSNFSRDAQSNIKSQVEASGAQHLHVAGIHALTALSRADQGPVTRLPVPFLCNDTLNRLWVNILMVVWES